MDPPSYNESIPLKMRINHIIEKATEEENKQKFFNNNLFLLLKDDLNSIIKSELVAPSNIDNDTIVIKNNTSYKYLQNIIDNNLKYFTKNEYYLEIAPDLLDSLKKEENINNVVVCINSKTYNIIIYINYSICFIFEGIIPYTTEYSIEITKLKPYIRGKSNTLNNYYIDMININIKMMADDMCKKIDNYICDYLKKNGKVDVIRINTLKLLDNYNRLQAMFCSDKTFINHHIKEIINITKDNIPPYKLFAYMQTLVIQHYMNEKFDIDINMNENFIDKGHMYQYNWTFFINL
jgi:hypothetical protein